MEGYGLLLSAVKQALPFTFVNGANSYASFCTRLLKNHYSLSYFDQAKKATFYSAPPKNSFHNFAGHTKREAFRAGE